VFISVERLIKSARLDSEARIAAELFSYIRRL